MMGSWTQQGGYPLLTVKRNYEDGSFTVSQEAFYNNENTKSDKLWYIPINYASQSKSDFRNTEASDYLLKVPSIKVDAKLGKDEWLILNKQSTGFYRINYDEQNWKMIVQGLIDSPYRVHARNRAQLIHDAYRFSISNRLSHSILLDMLTYLSNEEEYAPWATSRAIFDTFNRFFIDDKEYEHFKQYLAYIIEPVYEKFGIHEDSGEQHYHKITRNIVIHLANMAGLKNAFGDVYGKFKTELQGGVTIEPNLQSQFYCISLKDGSAQEFDYVFNKLMSINDQALRNSFISSLGCTERKEHLQKFFSSSIDTSNSLRGPERLNILSAAYSRSQAGLDAAIEFLQTNYQAYDGLAINSNKPVDTAIRGMSSYVVNSDQEAKLLELVTALKYSIYVNSDLETVVKSRIQDNYNWLKTNRGPIMTWMSSFRTSGSASLSLSVVSMATALLMVLFRLN
ncbi:aminopeptidase N-like [Musca vetustissima]|uniref:aminopeptidase N-like n=1 Tax=Musca vetustissima TaxID=27455 RepID=UPI002AB7BF01|nr:aminopeptidase N-like [Musca vetustissima]